MADRAPSRAKSPSGRETSFGLPTSGYKGWIPCLLKDGSHSKKPPVEAYKNAVTNVEYIPPGGWNDDPPCPTGELNTHTSDLFRKNYDQINWNTPGPKEPGKESDIWPPFAKIYMEI